MKTFKEILDEAKKAIQEVTVDQAKEILKKGQAIFIDVREPQEHEEGVVKGALRVPRGLLELQIERVVSDREKEIVIYCAGGARSALAAKALKDMGYQNVKSMAGGYMVWEAAGYDVEVPSSRQAEG